MSRRQAFFAHLGVLVSVLGLWSALSRPSVAQAPTEKPVVGRYHVAACHGSTGSGTVYITDTVTGQTWSRYGDRDAWVDLGSPIK